MIGDDIDNSEQPYVGKGDSRGFYHRHGTGEQ